MPGKETSFLLVTGDEFLRRSTIEPRLDRIFSPQSPRHGEVEGTSHRSTNLFRIYPDDLDWPSLIAQAQTASLLGGTQVFWVSQVDRIKKGDWSLFESYCRRPAPLSYFVFEADRLPRTHELIKLARRYGEHIGLDTRGAAETGLAILREKAKRAGKELTPGAWAGLTDRLGGAPRLMDLCLDQLILYVEGRTIDEQAVNRLATQWLRYEPFDLTEALAQKRVSEAIKIFHFFYELSGDVTSTVGLIHWQLRRLWQAKRILARGGRTDEMARTLRVPPFRMHQFLSQVRQFDLKTIERLIEELWEMDWKMKTGACHESIAMETFLAGVR